MWLSIPEPTVSAMRFSLVHIVFGPSIYCLLGFIHALSGPCKLCFWALSTLPLGLVYTVSWFCPHCFSTLSKGYLALSKLSLSIFPNFFESWSQCLEPCPYILFALGMVSWLFPHWIFALSLSLVNTISWRKLVLTTLNTAAGFT